MNRQVRELYKVLAEENVTPIELAKMMNDGNGSGSSITNAFLGLKTLNVLDLVEVYDNTKFKGIEKYILEEQQRIGDILEIKDFNIRNIPSTAYNRFMTTIMEEEKTAKKEKVLEAIHNYMWLNVMIQAYKSVPYTLDIPDDTNLRKIKSLNTLLGTASLFKTVFNMENFTLLSDEIIIKGLGSIRSELKIQKQEMEAATGIALQMLNAYESGVRKLSPNLIPAVRKIFMEKIEVNR